MGVDPSFRALSTSIYDESSNTIFINTISNSLGEGIGFEKIFSASRNLVENQFKYMDNLLKSEINQVDEVFSEVAPPSASFSSGLFALDTLLLSSMFDRYQSIKKVYSLSPSYLGTIHGTSKYSKSDSTKLAKYFISEVFDKDEFNIIIPDSISESGRRTKGKLNNDRAESFLFLLRAFVKYDIHGLRNKIISEMSGLGYEAEKLLIQRT